jgi:hypothetical protein
MPLMMVALRITTARLRIIMFFLIVIILVASWVGYYTKDQNTCSIT